MRRWTREAALDFMRRYAAEHGQPPQETWRAGTTGGPSVETLVRLFGSWSNAMLEAGLEARPRGDHRSAKRQEAADEETARAAARHDAGETLTAIAADLGCTGQALGRRVRGWRALYGVPAPPGTHTRGRPGRR